MWYTLAFMLGWFSCMGFTWVFNKFMAEPSRDFKKESICYNLGRRMGSLEELNKHSEHDIDIAGIEDSIKKKLGI